MWRPHQYQKKQRPQSPLWLVFAVLTFYSNVGLTSESKTKCLISLVSTNSEFREETNLRSFLKEDRGDNFIQRFEQSQKQDVKVDHSAHFYSGEKGHQILNNIVWNQIPWSPHNKVVGQLMTEIASGNHEVIQSYAGATLSRADFSRLRIGSDYSPHYFFSSSMSQKTADRFLHKFGNHHLPQTHVKVRFEIYGTSGLDISSLSEFHESEVLFAPDAKFLVVDIQKQSKKVNAFETYTVFLEESTPLPPRISDRNKAIPFREFDYFRMLSREFVDSNRPNRIDSNAFFFDEYYTADNLSSYRDAVEFINSIYLSKTASIDLLKEIHEIALNGHFFEGFYRRRVRQRLFSEQINFGVAFNQLLEIKKQNDELNFYLPGLFRKTEVDNFVMTGLHLDLEGHRYFEKQELYSLSLNPYFQIETTSIKPIGTDRFEANVLFEPVEKLEHEVLQSLNEALNNLTVAKSDYDYVMRVLILQKKLISLHPFHDGNGRAIKLFCDLLYLKRGLYPPLMSNDRDYELGYNELYRQTVNEMWAYQKLATAR